MSENEKKELNENELEKASGGVRSYSDSCNNFEGKTKGIIPVKRCTECKHYTQISDVLGYCDFDK